MTARADGGPDGRGVLLAVAARACFAAYDTSTKYLGATVPVVVALWVR
ncbi:hypothetical protein [Derxia gummosa]|uniref:Uncharacterized protein n=1 Tax=Derxia gummosa DSM 723 TaxID=1121388 RepID=A0A8B6XCP5_9BURK|nr:hypothetical protein [Derxia gummosa]